VKGGGSGVSVDGEVVAYADQTNYDDKEWDIDYEKWDALRLFQDGYFCEHYGGDLEHVGDELIQD
jgi:DNA mismatch repair ATPase MutS